jgi:hypothetical protein
LCDERPGTLSLSHAAPLVLLRRRAVAVGAPAL